MSDRPEYALYNRRQGELARPPAASSGGPANLADILERVLDKGIVIAGDIQINLLDIELLTIKLRLLVASVERAQEMGINWWESDPTLSKSANALEEENKDLRERLDRLERIAGLPAPQEGEEVIFEEKREEIITADGEKEVNESTREEVVESKSSGRKSSGRKSTGQKGSGRKK